MLSSREDGPGQSTEHRSPIRGIVTAGRRRRGMAPLLDAVDLETIPLFRGLTPSEQRHLHNLLGVRTFPRAPTFSRLRNQGTSPISSSTARSKFRLTARMEQQSSLPFCARARLGRDEPRRQSWPLGHGRGDGADHAGLVDARRLLDLPAVDADDGIQPGRHSFPAAAPVECARRSLATLDIEGRLADQLLALCEEYGEATPVGGCRIPFRLTQGDLAALVGASSRVRVNQILVRWQPIS